jgi:NAD-dependent deacetylase
MRTGAGTQIRQLAELVAAARHAVAFTGAGISAESGIPVYRGAGGLWTKFDPYKVAHIETFRADPSQYWRHSRDHRRGGAEPNPAHLALAMLERAGHLHGVITQNTDGLHQRAGSREVVELHGSSHYVVCLDCERRFDRAEIDRLNTDHCPPSCPACGGRFLKPTVVMFGEALPTEALQRAQMLAMASDLMLIVGSSLQVYPAAGIPRLAREQGADLCIVNAEPTPFDGLAAVAVQGKAGEILPEMLRQMGQL